MIKERSTTLEGAFNWRDLGGVSTADGYEVKRGKLFRADALHKLTDTDMSMLADIRISSIVDLRSTPELNRSGKARLVEQGATHMQIPVMEDVSQEAMPRELGDIYMHMVNVGADRFVEVLEHLSSIENMPAVFHCTAGKDRTGITAAFIYSILGVDREDIIADYVLTDAVVPKIMERIKAEQPELLARAEGKPVRQAGASDTILRSFLDTMDEEFDGPVAWLRKHGLTDSAMETLRNEMLSAS